MDVVAKHLTDLPLTLQEAYCKDVLRATEKATNEFMGKVQATYPGLSVKVEEVDSLMERVVEQKTVSDIVISLNTSKNTTQRARHPSGQKKKASGKVEVRQLVPRLIAVI